MPFCHSLLAFFSGIIERSHRRILLRLSRRQLLLTPMGIDLQLGDVVGGVPGRVLILLQ